MTDQFAYVRLGGEVIASTADAWAGAERLALAGLTIKWGRTSRYDDVPPAVLSFSFLDPNGWVFTKQLQGEVIDVSTRPDFSPINLRFRGRIQDVDAKERKLRNRATGKTVTVWEVSVTARDPLAAAGQAVVAGPGAAGEWPAESISARFARILAALASPHIGLIYSASAPSQPLRPHAAPDGMNLLDMIRRAFAAISAPAPQYVPYWPGTPGAILPATIRQNQGLALDWTGTEFRIVTASTNDRVLPASIMRLPSKPKFSATGDSALDVVQVTHQDTAGVDQMTERRSASYDPAGRAVRVLKVESDLRASTADDLANQLVQLVNSTNGQWAHPPVRYVQKNPSNDPNTRTYVEDEGVYFQGSKWAGLPMPAIHQVIGGTLKCDGKSWTHDLNLAPAVGVPATVGINALVPPTLTVPTFQDFHPSVTLADLGSVTRGAS